MNAYENFIKAVEEYYGDYRPAVKGILIEYLKKQIVPDRLKTFYSILINNYTNTYKIPPDIAIMNKYLDDDFYNKHVPVNGIKQIECNDEKMDIDEIDKLFNKIYDKFNK